MNATAQAAAAEVLARAEADCHPVERVLGNPATAVAWLANKVHPFGVRLEAGHVVLPGSCTRAYDVQGGQIVRADFDRLGSVSAVFA